MRWNNCGPVDEPVVHQAPTQSATLSRMEKVPWWRKVERWTLRFHTFSLWLEILPIPCFHLIHPSCKEL